MEKPDKLLVVIPLLVVCLFAVNSLSAEFTGSQLRVGDLQPQLRFGSAVAATDEVLLIGANGDATGGEFSGVAFVFARTNGVWVETERLISPNPLPNDWFGSSVAVEGDTIVCGLTGYSDDTYAGSAHVFHQTTNGWDYAAELTASDAAAWDLFGQSLDVSGDTIVVGTPRSWWTDPPGSVYVFDLVGGVWTQVAKLVALDARPYDHFGQSVSIDGDVLVVGGWGEPASADDHESIGSAYVFERTAGVWQQRAALRPVDAELGDNYGSAVSVSGTTIVVGAPGEDGNAGSVYVYEWLGSWTQTARLRPSPLVSGSGFGTSVAISENVVAVGTLGALAATYVFERDGSSWSQFGVIQPHVTNVPSWFDCPVATANGVFVIGIAGDDNPEINSGSAHVFEWDTDSDGAGDTTEMVIGTQKENPDSDGDGSLDGQEVMASTDPLDSNDVFRVCSSGNLASFHWVRWDAKGGNIYHVEKSVDSRTWTVAPSNSINEVFESSRWPSNDTTLLYLDTASPAEKAFYRISTERTW